MKVISFIFAALTIQALAFEKLTYSTERSIEDNNTQFVIGASTEDKSFTIMVGYDEKRILHYEDVSICIDDGQSIIPIKITEKGMVPFTQSFGTAQSSIKFNYDGKVDVIYVRIKDLVLGLKRAMKRP